MKLIVYCNAVQHCSLIVTGTWRLLKGIMLIPSHFRSKHMIGFLSPHGTKRQCWYSRCCLIEQSLKPVHFNAWMSEIWLWWCYSCRVYQHLPLARDVGVRVVKRCNPSPLHSSTTYTTWSEIFEIKCMGPSGWPHFFRTWFEGPFRWRPFGQLSWHFEGWMGPRGALSLPSNHGRDAQRRHVPAQFPPPPLQPSVRNQSWNLDWTQLAKNVFYCI